jgi:hypothetical protein
MKRCRQAAPSRKVVVNVATDFTFVVETHKPL